jgi:hypothetical protein
MPLSRRTSSTEYQSYQNYLGETFSEGASRTAKHVDKVISEYWYRAN